MDSAKLPQSRKEPFDRINALVAASVFIIAFIVYFLTKAPTLSFWDCGEFITAAYTLGVPHPPGSPLWVLMGRIFALLPIAGDIAVRINIFSVLCSATATTFGYLIVVRLISYWYDDRENIYNRIIAYIGGFTGALFMAFGSTNWGNSVETEVYSLAMLFVIVIYWLALRYFQDKETASGTRTMLLILFLGMLGIGVHLSMFVVMPVLGLYFILDKKAGPREWAIVSFFFMAELYFIFELSSRPGEVSIYLPTLILFIIFLFHSGLAAKWSRPYLISVALYLVSLYPLYLVIWSAFAENILHKDIVSTIDSLKGIPLGWIGLIALVLWGLAALFKYLSGRDDPEVAEVWLLPAIYSLAPIMLIMVGLIFNGYLSFIILSIFAMAAVGVLLWRHINWLVLVGVIALSLVILGFWHLVVGLVAASLVMIILGYWFKDKGWRTALLIILVAAVGYSIHFSIPIRSAQKPTLDMNSPSKSLDAMVGYLERKQYGSESMVHRMFVRRGSWENQFGNYQRMGFWGFFKEQYGFPGPRFFAVFVLGLLGIWESIRRKPDIGLPLLVLILICSVGLVLYMNFADGTRQNPITGEDYLEVRDRDYFFTPAFIFFGLAIGLGIAAVMDLIRETTSNLKPALSKSLFGATALLVLLPLVPLRANYFISDRSRNFMPYDYSRNYLETCDKDAIVFTNGDNDTFPLWCLQQVYGIRRDVRVVNLSLANTPWYVKQLRDKSGVPLDLSDEAIDRLRPYYINDTDISRIQDQIVEHVLEANKWRYPVYMTVTVPESSKRFHGQSLNDNLVLEGMVYHLTPKKGRNQINYEKTWRLFLQEYSYRGVSDPAVYKDENARRLIGNYAQGYLVIADSIRRAGDMVGAFDMVKQGMKVLPWSYDLYAYGAQLLAQMGRTDTMRAFVENAPTDEKWKLYFNWGISAKIAGRAEDAIKTLELTHKMYPDYADAYRALVTMYYENRYFSELRKLVADWVSRHPEDSESRRLLQEIQNVNRSADTAEGIRR